MIRRALVVVGLVAGLSLLVAGPAVAAALRSEIPTWYDSTPSPQYAPSGPPQPVSFDNSQDAAAQTRYQESFYMPGGSGSGPTPGQPDVEADIKTTNTVMAQLPIAGTAVADAFGTPLEAFSIDAAKGIPMSVSASVQDGQVVLHRADPICKLPDNWRFDQIQVPMLMSSPQGQQQQVMLSVSIQFGDRHLAVKAQCAVKKATATATATATAEQSASATPSANPTKEPIKARTDRVKQKVADTKAKAQTKAQEIKADLTKKVSHPDISAFMGWAVAAVIVAGLAWLWYQRHSPKTSTPPARGTSTRNHDGTPKSETKPSRSW
jgi:hypothetical protein